MAPKPQSDTQADGPIVAWDRRAFYWGRSQGENANLHDAIAAAVNQADMPDGTPFSVVYSEVESVGDPNVGAYNVVITPGP